MRYLPSFLAAVERDARLSDLRQIRVEGLLGRREVHVVSQKAATLIAGRRVLVTGAGGSIGSELCRQIRCFGPESLYLLDHDESNLHRLQLEITGSGLLDADEIIIADIRDQRRIDQVFAAIRPELVFHAAAHKHLPLLERHPCEAVKSNVRGTQNLVDAAIRHGTSRFVLISTDKAADPTSVLGASKRLAELVVQRRRGRPGDARLGPLRQCPGQPRVVPVGAGRPDSQGRAGHGDAPGSVPVLHDGGRSGGPGAGDGGHGRVRRDLRPRHGRAGPDRQTWSATMPSSCKLPNVEIRYTGLRPGEKLAEKVFSDAEERVPSAHPKIWATRCTEPPADFGPLLDRLYAAADDGDAAQAKELLRQLVPEYEPSERLETPVSVGAPYPDGF